MPLISRRSEKTKWRRTNGIYGHLPKFYKPDNYWRPLVSDTGYIAVLTDNYRYNFHYMGNPYRPGKIIERFPRFDRKIDD